MPTDTLLNTTQNKPEGIYNTNKLTGKFILIVKTNMEYTIQVQAQGYATYTRKINASALNQIDKIKLQRTGQ